MVHLENSSLPNHRSPLVEGEITPELVKRPPVIPEETELTYVLAVVNDLNIRI